MLERSLVSRNALRLACSSEAPTDQPGPGRQTPAVSQPQRSHPKADQEMRHDDSDDHPDQEAHDPLGR